MPQKQQAQHFLLHNLWPVPKAFGMQTLLFQNAVKRFAKQSKMKSALYQFLVVAFIKSYVVQILHNHISGYETSQVNFYLMSQGKLTWSVC